MCEAHLPHSVGNVMDFSQLIDVWHSATAHRIQQTIVDRSFDYCAVQHCGIVNQSILMSRHHLGINIDESCNLACPSCRNSMINHTSGSQFDQKLQMVNHLVNMINQFDQPLCVSVCGSGDPLASAILRPLFLNWRPKLQHTMKLQTNGLLMKKLLADSVVLPYISEFNISVDAGTKSVYEIVRQPGRFDVLQENLAWLAHNRPAGSQVTLLFVISQSNVEDIVAFADLCEHYGFVGEYTKLDNWGTFDRFEDHDVVGQIHHPLHNRMLDLIRQVQDRDGIRVQSFVRNLI